MVDSFEHLLVFPNDSEQFLFPKGLVKGSIETGVGFIVIFLLRLQVGALIAWDRIGVTFAFDLLNFFEEDMIGPLNLSIFDVFEGVTLFGLFKESELFCSVMGEFAFHGLEFLFVDFPVTFQFFIEADLVRDGDCTEHSLY